MTPVTPAYYGAVSVRYGQSSGIVQNTGADWFGPLNPLAPTAPPEVAGRRFDFIPGYNLVTTPRSYEVIGFPTLRLLAESFDILRLVIESRKDELCRLGWKVRVREDDDGDEEKTTPEQQASIDEITKFFKRPDGVNRWRPWLRSILEDRYVIDAASLYNQRNRGGKLIALKPLDGATIKVIIDDWGRTPTTPTNGVLPPAYQQVLKGFPAVNYTVRDVTYRPYNRRVHKVYGYSPVEQIIMTVNIALRRQMFQLSYYTEGNIPEALIGTPDEWTPEQISAFQVYWDSMFTGNLAKRRHAKFVPGGMAKTYMPTKEPDLKNPMDEWLARVVCFAFSISPQAFVAMMNRATAGTAAETAKEQGIEPDKEWVKELIDDVIENEFGRADLEFAFDEEVEVDQEKQQKIISAYVESGLKTINQGREMMGDEPDPNPAADVLMVKTGTGYFPVDANTIEGKQAAIDAGIAADPTAVPDVGAFNPAGAGGKPPAAKPAPKPAKTPPAAKHAPHAILTPAMAKAVRRRRSGRAVDPIPFDRPKIRAIVGSLTETIYRAFRKAAKAASSHVRAELSKVAKAGRRRDPDEVARELAADVDLSAIEEIVPDIGDELGAAASDAGRLALAQVGPDDASGLVDVVDARAVAQARDFAAELVGKRYNADGELVDAVRPEYRIDDTTRDEIRDLIADGLEENVGTEAIADNIEESTAFSRERAELVAHTEVRRANSMGALEGYQESKDAGVNLQKEWVVDVDPCPICEENGDEGAIDLDDEFPSGDDAPPAHPNCECAISPVVLDDEEE
jgi:hypothetical protein